MDVKFIKRTCAIPKGEFLGYPLFTGGARLRRIAIPVDELGKPALSGSTLSFVGSINGTDWFPLLTVRGEPFFLLMNYKTFVIEAGEPMPEINLPISDPGLFEGLQMIRLKSNAREEEDIVFDLYFG